MGLSKLKIHREISTEFLDKKVEDLHSYLGGPTLFHIEQGEGRPIFISTLLHGNEHSGVIALQRYLKNNLESLTRPLILFIGNTLAAKTNERHLKDQVDFNRVWSGGDCELALMAKDVISYVKEHDPFCSVDIHNNTGKNPFYSCTNKIDDEFLYLASMFSDKIVYFTEPSEVQSMAFSKICPSITIEAGRSKEEAGIETLIEKIDQLFKLDNFPKGIDRASLNVFHTTSRMMFTQDATLDFDMKADSKNDFSFVSNIDDHNFLEVEKGELIGFVNNRASFYIEKAPLEDLFDEYFEVKEGKLFARQSFIPAMISKDIQIIKDDCFGYIMERFPV